MKKMFWHGPIKYVATNARPPIRQDLLIAVYVFGVVFLIVGVPCFFGVPYDHPEWTIPIGLLFAVMTVTDFIVWTVNKIEDWWYSR